MNRRDIVPAGMPATDVSRSWPELVAAYEHVNTELRAHEMKGSPDSSDPAIDDYEETTSRLGHAAADAIDALLLAPAPDLPALAKKLEIFHREHISDGWDCAGTISAQLAQDAARLISEV